MLRLDQIRGVSVTQIRRLGHASALVGPAHVVSISISIRGVTGAPLGLHAGPLETLAVVRGAGLRLLGAPTVHGVGVLGLAGPVVAVTHGYVVAVVGEAAVLLGPAVLDTGVGTGVVDVVGGAGALGLLAAAGRVAGDAEHDGEDDGEARGDAGEVEAPAVVVHGVIVGCFDGNDDDTCCSVESSNKHPHGSHAIVLVATVTAAVVSYSDEDGQ